MTRYVATGTLNPTHSLRQSPTLLVVQHCKQFCSTIPHDACGWIWKNGSIRQKPALIVVILKSGQEAIVIVVANCISRIL